MPTPKNAVDRVMFRYFNFMHERVWLSPRGRFRDEIVATAPAWGIGLLIAFAVYLSR